MRVAAGVSGRRGVLVVCGMTHLRGTRKVYRPVWLPVPMATSAPATPSTAVASESRRIGGPHRTDLMTSAGLVVMWSSGFVGAELGTATATAATVLAWRFLALAVVLVAICAFMRVRPSRAAVR